MDEKEIKDLFYNKLSLENNIREIFQPFNNTEDYIKYGDMFLKLKSNKYESVQNYNKRIK